MPETFPLVQFHTWCFNKTLNETNTWESLLGQQTTGSRKADQARLGQFDLKKGAIDHILTCQSSKTD